MPKINLLVPDYILSIAPYVPGKPVEEVEREFGIRNSIKLASNENPLGTSSTALQAIQQAMGKLNRYPDDSGVELIERIAEKLTVLPENIVLGNGSDDVISMLAKALLQPKDEAIIPQPSFSWYEISVRSSGALPIGVPLKSNVIDLEGILDRITPKTRMIFINNPHNPTGSAVRRDALEQFIQVVPSEIVVVIDEAYIEFVSDPRCPKSIDYIKSNKVIVGLRTFSKAYGLAGLRIGYGVMPSYLADLLNRVRQPFNVNSLAQAAAVAALADDDFLENTVQLVHAELEFLYGALSELGLDYLRSQANFLLIKLKKNANEVFEDLLKQGIIVRSMSSYGYPDCIRVNIGLHDENIRFLDALKKTLINL
jgi:histidinol-phosphate aminotransferase